MKGFGSLIWKEWMHARWFLLGGLGVLIGVPILPLIQHGISSDMLETFVLILGWVFAIFTATGLFCSDLEDRLYGFWQSRPVALWKWALVKYCMGLLCVLAVCLIPVTVILILRFYYPPQWETQTDWAILFYVSYTIMLIYSLSVLISCLVRKTTHAAILSVAAGLLVYFLPLLLPALEPVSVLNMITRGAQPKLEVLSAADEKIGSGFIGVGKESWGYYYGSPQWVWLRLPASKALVFRYFPGYWRFVGIMLSLSAGALALGTLSLKLHWKIRMNQKLLFWTLGFTALLLFASGAFAIGSNLEPEAIIEPPYLSQSVGVLESTLAENQGILILGVYPEGEEQYDYSIIRFRYTDQYEQEIFIWDKPGLKWNARYILDMVWLPDKPDMLWLLIAESDDTDSNHYTALSLVTLYLDPDTMKAQQTDEQLLAEHTSTDNSWPAGSGIEVYGNHLFAYVFGKLIVLDINGPQRPVIAEQIEKWNPQWMQSGSAKGVELRYNPVPVDEFSDFERADISARMSRGMSVSNDGQEMAEVSRDFIRLYHYESTENEYAVWQSFAHRVPTPLERLIDAYPRKSVYRDNILYVLNDEGRMGKCSLTVYRVEDDGSIRKINHFARAVRTLNDFSVLEDGRILLVGEDKLFILPPARD